MISVLSIVHDTTVDGPGFRTSIYCAGCPNVCPGCHNPQSWDIANGHWMTTADIIKELRNDPFANVTFTGGDPMFQPEGFCELADVIKSELGKSIWCFSGFTFEQIYRDKQKRSLLERIDVLVDGPFIQKLRDPDLLFRGSSNQRIIDVRKTLVSCLAQPSLQPGEILQPKLWQEDE